MLHASTPCAVHASEQESQIHEFYPGAELDFVCQQLSFNMYVKSRLVITTQ